ncbi:hypothetical protein MMC17_002439 [Xylographa soralifera]|nr:hypothetical protein [Xylographa soralifera]
MHIKLFTFALLLAPVITAQHYLYARSAYPDAFYDNGMEMDIYPRDAYAYPNIDPVSHNNAALYARRLLARNIAVDHAALKVKESDYTRLTNQEADAMAKGKFADATALTKKIHISACTVLVFRKKLQAQYGDFEPNHEAEVQLWKKRAGQTCNAFD